MKIAIVLHTKLGSFESELIDVNRQQLSELELKSKDFFLNQYDFKTSNGYVVFPPDIVKESILEIKIKKKHVSE